ncbi:hypothetical protein LDENG_00243340 [Lucifuga dentata]|nr:hypothetical protein LDENG_00243340 [Lucifuga dentata]
MSASQAEEGLYLLFYSGTNIEEHLQGITANTQPYLLAEGAENDAVHHYHSMQVSCFSWCL